MHPEEEATVHIPALPLTHLVDVETGLIRRVKTVRTPARAPHRYVSMTAEVADARALGDWPADRVSLGTTFVDAEQAWTAAVAEGVERYCGNFLPAHLDPFQHRVATRRDLLAHGLAVLGLDELPRFAPWQLTDDFPYINLSEDTPTLWARCQERAGGEVWAPASLVHLNWRQRRFRHLPRVHHLNYAGIATGQGHQDARDRAVLEVVERDALEVWWHLDGPTRGIDLASVPGLAQDLAGCDLQVWLVQMPSEFAPCVGALVHDKTTGLFAAGFACKLDPADAARKAVLEAVHTWIYSQGVQDADGWVFQAVDAGLMATGLTLDHRADLRYLDDVGDHFARVRDLGAHVQVWLDPRTHYLARRFTHPADGTVDVTDLTPTTMQEVYARLAAGGHRVISRDLTTSDVAQTTLRVQRVLVTGLVPNAPAAFSYFGCERFQDAAHDRGWPRGRTDRPGELTLVPAPHM